VKRLALSARALLALLLGGCGGAPLAQDGGVDEAGADASFSATLPDGMCKTFASRFTGGACECPSEVPDVCATSCVDLATDGDNCGACGHVCAAQAACAHGVCGPSPVFVVHKPRVCGDFKLATAGDTLYWTDTAAGKVMAMPVAGGAPMPVSGAETTKPTLLFANGSTVFWLDGKTIRKSTAGVVSDVYMNPDDINGLTTSDDGATVYFSTGPRIRSVPAAGGATPIDVEVHSDFDTMALAVAGDYLASTSHSGEVYVTRLSGPPAQCDTSDPMRTFVGINCNTVAWGQGWNFVAITASDVVWVDGPNISMGERVVDGMSRPYDFVTTTDNGNINSMIVSGGAVYFDNVDPTGLSEIDKAPLAVNATRVRLARNLRAAGSIAVSGEKVFWATGYCEIQSVPTGE
jgi:Stigma-specific protein, Stig1